jgi:DNA-binding MarR family transcriptional regulator
MAAGDDWVDRYVARMCDHWIGEPFDDDIEAMWARMVRLTKRLQGVKRESVRAVGLEDFQYDTLQSLMVRDNPGRASPTTLAADLGVSPPGMTGRLDTMEKAGWIERQPSADDRRRIEIRVTKEGVRIWREAMNLPRRYESELAATLTRTERRTMNRLLKKLTLSAEQGR